MKASKQLQQAIAAAYRKNLAAINAHELSYLQGTFPRAHLVKDLQRRYRWDMFWFYLNTPTVARMIADEGLNNDHVNTLLRATVPRLDRSASHLNDLLGDL